MKSVTALFLCVAAGSFMVIFDGAAVQMTLPAIQQSLGGSIQEVETRSKHKWHEDWNCDNFFVTVHC